MTGPGDEGSDESEEQDPVDGDIADDPLADPAEPAFSAGPDRTDGRPRRDWQTRYRTDDGEPDKHPLRRIQAEGAYLFFLLIASPLTIGSIYLEGPDGLDISKKHYAVAARWAYAYMGGLFGGTLFSTKWLYHAVATGYWNRDRWLWRIFTPFLSAGLAFLVVLLIQARLLPLIGYDVVQSSAGVLAVGMFVGYVSDDAASSLSELAERLFGKAKRNQRKLKRLRKLNEEMSKQIAARKRLEALGGQPGASSAATDSAGS